MYLALFSEVLQNIFAEDKVVVIFDETLIIEVSNHNSVICSLSSHNYSRSSLDYLDFQFVFLTVVVEIQQIYFKDKMIKEFFSCVQFDKLF